MTRCRVDQAFVSYMKSIYLQKDKTIFDLTALPIEAFAASLGLPGAPQIKFIGQAHAKKNEARGKSQQEEVERNVAGEKEVPTQATLEVAAAESESDESEIGSDGDESGVEVDFKDDEAVVEESGEDDSESEEEVGKLVDDAVVKKVSRWMAIAHLSPGTLLTCTLDTTFAGQERRPN